MKLPASPTHGINQDSLVNWLRTLASSVAAGWNVEHGSDGLHNWHWRTPAFDATRFTGDGTITWTVQAGDVAAERYARLGNLLVWNLVIAGSSTGGAASTAFYVRMPENLVLGSTVVTVGYASDAGTAITSVITGVRGSRQVIVQRNDGGNWSNAAANNTSVYFQLVCEVA